MNHTCLCLSSRSWYSFTDPGGMEGWVGLGLGLYQNFTRKVSSDKINLKTLSLMFFVLLGGGKHRRLPVCLGALPVYVVSTHRPLHCISLQSNQRGQYRNISSPFSIVETILNNVIHHKSGSNEYKDKQTNLTKLTLSSTYINRNIMVNHVSECVYTQSYQPNCMRLIISFLICLTEHLVIQI